MTGDGSTRKVAAASSPDDMARYVAAIAAASALLRRETTVGGAGVVAAAGTFARDYPQYRVPAYAAAAAAALMQIPRCKHYPSDVGAGAAIGAAAAAAVNAIDPDFTGG